MKNIPQRKKASRPAKIHRLISSIRSLNKRNQLRGYCSKPEIFPADIEAIRSNNSFNDSIITGEVLKGPLGLMNEPTRPRARVSSDLFTISSISPLDWQSEVGYTAGYINSFGDQAVEMLFAIKSLAPLETIDSDTALELLFNLSKAHGASNFLSHKLAYLKCTRDFSVKSTGAASEIEDVIGHHDNPGLHLSALENMNSEVSLFAIVQRRVSSFAGKINSDFRKAISLNNIIPTPLDQEDVAGYLLRATESCLIDTVYAVLVIFNLDEDLLVIRQEFESCLEPHFLEQLLKVIQYTSTLGHDDIVTDYYKGKNEGGDLTLNLYRISSAFLERPRFTIYRNKLDRVFGARLLEEVIGEKACTVSTPLNEKVLLLARKNTPLDDVFPIHLDSFYRTFLFLRFIGNKTNLLNISSDEIKYIFEMTLGLDTLLTEEEMTSLYVIAEPAAKSLFAVLTLALYRNKSIDPDIDFEFRADFITLIKSEHDGSITNFINYLLSDSPQVASYIVRTLDEVTLEKMYSLVTNASQASEIRCDILRTLGQKLNRIEYIIEADEITTRSKVSKLIHYFDSSRMYVDSVSMKKWLDSNPTVSVVEYRSLYTRLVGSISSVENRKGNEPSIVIIQLHDQGHHLIAQIVKDAFEQFCLNTEFGIESYLGRRIRHNTLDGVTTDSVDAVLRRQEYRPFLSSPTMQATVHDWLASYKSIIDKLRRDHLQFKPSGSLFKSTLDLDDPATNENIRKLSSTLRLAGGCDLLNDLVISFCWLQISPQLESAARFIKTKLLNEANASIDKAFLGHRGAIEVQLKTELLEVVNEVFKKIADWFQIPQTGFVSASVRDLCEIISIELHCQEHVRFSGDAIETKYTGISVHRLYDCLAVLLQNAHKHGENAEPIFVIAEGTQGRSESSLARVCVDVTSSVSEEDYEKSKNRVLSAVKLEEGGIDMVTEGYTGIKKIKFITRASEGKHTLNCEPNDDARELKLGFTILAETATTISETDNAS